MVSVLILCLTMSTVTGYTIKMNGNIEMGQEIAKVLEQIRDTITRNGGADTVQKFLSVLTEEDPKVVQGSGSNFKWRPVEKTELSLVRESPFVEKKTHAAAPYEKEDMALLDEMVNGNEEEAHVYGRHKQSVRQYPMNEINV